MSWISSRRRLSRRNSGICINTIALDREQVGEPVIRPPGALAAAIDRIVHHSAILEFDVPSYRTAEAKAMQAPSESRTGGSRRPDSEKNTKRSPGARTRPKAGTKQ